MFLTHHPQYGVKRQKEREPTIVAELEYVQYYVFIFLVRANLPQLGS
jgi:hypothetical protein